MSTAIRVHNLRFGYSSVEVLHGISFEIRRGEITGLLGPNGAGKTTTLKILAGILEPRDGQVEVQELRMPEQAVEVKKRIGYVPESAELYESLTALEFLELCGRLHDIEDRSLYARIDSLLDGFELSDQRQQRLGTYSKGMRQKVLMAAALLHDPALILLDEPLTGLDVESAVLVKGLLAALASRGKTILYSSHVLDVVERICSRVLIINKGVLIADGSPDALKERARESSLEAVFRELTDAESAEPRVQRILEGLQS